jgi:glycosyltransferase involved in cell wall biosynthesis
VVDVIDRSASARELLRDRVVAMRARGIDNHILCGDERHAPALRAAGIPVHTLRLPRAPNPLRFMIALIGIARYLRRHRVHLVHTHGSIPGVVGRLAAWCAGVPLIVHTDYGLHRLEHLPWPRRLLHIAIERACGLLTDTLMSPNPGDLAQAERYGIGPRDRRHRMGSGIDADRFHPSRRNPRPGAMVTVTCVASLEPAQDHSVLFEAIRILRSRGEHFRVWWVGDGRLRARHERVCRRLGLEDSVDFLDDRDGVPAILAQTDIAVLTPVEEGLPRAVLEAMAMEIPVVATRASGVREAVRHGDTGLTVGPLDPEGLAAALALLMSDPALRAGMGRRGRAVAIQEYDERRVVAWLHRLYRARLHARAIACRGEILRRPWHVATPRPSPDDRRLGASLANGRAGERALPLRPA